ncbi:MAG: preprotein translocase subunit SecE [Gemmiger sp.]
MAENKKVDTTAQAPEKKAKKADAPKKKTSFMAKVKGFFGGILKYFKDTKSELKKVVWPSKKDVKTNTITVIIVVAIAAVVLILLDMIFGGVIHLMIGA